MSKRDLTAETLREHLSYDPGTGVFTRRKSNTNAVKAGTVAGSLARNGYVTIMVNGHMYKAHRLAWLYVYGVWPAHHIDHINGVKHDNRIANLRDVPMSINAQNLRAAKRANPYLGVSYHKAHNNWRATIKINGRYKHLGSFDTPEDARDAYLEAKRKLHVGCTI